MNNTSRQEEDHDQQSRISTSWGDDNVHGREEFLLQRRRCFICISTLPFVVSAIALCTVLAGAPQTLGASSVALRGNSNGKDKTPQTQESYLADLGTLPSESFIANNTSTTSSVSPAPTAFDTTTDEPSTQESYLADLGTFPSETFVAHNTSTTSSVSPATTVFDTTSDEPPAPVAITTITVEATTAGTQTETSSTTVATAAAAVSVVTADIHDSHLSTTNEKMTTPHTTTSQIGSCEEATTHEQCTSHTSKCVWFSPLNWSELCFTKPSFPLKDCKEVRLVDDCLQSAVGCIWTMETKPGPDKDICRFSRHSTSVRGGKPGPKSW